MLAALALDAEPVMLGMGMVAASASSGPFIVSCVLGGATHLVVFGRRGPSTQRTRTFAAPKLAVEFAREMIDEAAFAPTRFWPHDSRIATHDPPKRRRWKLWPPDRNDPVEAE